jgi:hypothetical protein
MADAMDQIDQLVKSALEELATAKNAGELEARGESNISVPGEK